MKKLDALQLTLIIIGILVLYNTIPVSIQFISYAFLWFYEGLKGGDYMYGFIETILFLAFYLIFSIYLINNSKKVATTIINKTHLNNEINLNLNKTEIIYVVLIAMGLYGMITNLPSLIRDGYFFIKGNNDFNSNQPVKITGGILFTNACTVGLFFTLLYYADVFSDFFSKKINNEEDEIDNPIS